MMNQIQYPIVALAYPDSNKISVANLSDPEQPIKTFEIEGLVQMFVDVRQHADQVKIGYFNLNGGELERSVLSLDKPFQKKNPKDVQFKRETRKIDYKVFPRFRETLHSINQIYETDYDKDYRWGFLYLTDSSIYTIEKRGKNLINDG